MQNTQNPHKVKCQFAKRHKILARILGKELYNNASISKLWKKKHAEIRQKEQLMTLSIAPHLSNMVMSCFAVSRAGTQEFIDN